MNKQRKVLITVTYNEMGIIIDTKAEEVAQPNLQPTCNQLATEIVMCKDCRYSEHWYGNRRRCFLWNEDGVSVFDDGFCNYGEKGEQDE